MTKTYPRLRIKRSGFKGKRWYVCVQITKVHSVLVKNGFTSWDACCTFTLNYLNKQ